VLPEICVAMQVGITNGSFRDMGKTIRATIGFAIALTLLNGEGFWARLRTPAVLAVKADIAAQNPTTKLESSLHGWLSSRNGTSFASKPAGGRARALQF
jgi:hypothetical protein